MNEEKQMPSSEEKDGSKNWKVGFILFLFVAIGVIAAWLYRQFEKKASKPELAQRYGVSTKVLINWIRLLCPEDVQQKYVGVKSNNKVVVAEIYRYLGKPEERPRTSRDRDIVKREDFIWALNISSSTLKRNLKTIEDPNAVIGMSYETFGKLRILPPLQVELILNYMESQGYAKR